MKQLEEKLSRSENKSEQFEFRFHDANKLINSLTNWIETLFHTIDCDKNIAKELAGSQQVTEGNMMVFLGIIEERISFILQAYSQITLEKNKDTYNQLLSNISQLTATALKDKPNKEIGNLGNRQRAALHRSTHSAPSAALFQSHQALYQGFPRLPKVSQGFPRLTKASLG